MDRKLAAEIVAGLNTGRTVTKCADCGRTLHTEYDKLYHACPEQAKNNKRAQRKQGGEK